MSLPGPWGAPLPSSTIASPAPRLRRLERALALAVIVATTIAYYHPLRFDTLMGDDLLSFLFPFATGDQGPLAASFLRSHFGPYRPLTDLFVYGRTHLFGTSYTRYFHANLILLLLGCGLLFVTLSRLTGNKTYATVLSLFYVLHHFQYYPALVRTGEVDLLPTMTFIVLVSLLVRFHEESRRAHLWAAAGTFAALVFMREIYLFATPVLVLVALGLGRSSPARGDAVVGDRPRPSRRWLPAAAFVLASVAYVVMRFVALRGNFAQVPGTAPSFAPASVARSYAIFLLDVFTVFLNEDWFTGIGFSRVPPGLQVLQISFVLFNAWLSISYARNRSVVRREKQFVLAIAGIGLLLLVPAALTGKHDLRYVSGSVVCYLTVAAFAVRALPSRPVRIAALVLVALVTGANALYFRKHIGDLYFVGASRIASAARRATIDRYGKALSRYALYLPNADGLRWPLLDGAFFRVHLGDPGFQPRFYDSLDAIDLDREKPLVLSFDPSTNRFRDITEEVVARRARQIAGTPGRELAVRYDLVATYRTGSVTPAEPASTPTGEGVFQWKGASESGAGAALTMLSGFHLRYPGIRPERGDSLVLVYRTPLGRSDGAGFRIALRTETGESTVIYDDPHVLPADGWRRGSVGLGDFTGHTVELEAEVYSPTGDAAADWVTFDRFAIVSTEEERPLSHEPGAEHRRRDPTRARTDQGGGRGLRGSLRTDLTK